MELNAKTASAAYKCEANRIGHEFNYVLYALSHVRKKCLKSNYSPKNANTLKSRTLMSYSNHVILMKLCSLMIWSVILRNNYINSLFIFSLLFLFCKSCFSYNFVYNSSVPHVTYVLSDNKLTWRHVTIFFLLKHLANFIRNYATC